MGRNLILNIDLQLSSAWFVFEAIRKYLSPFRSDIITHQAEPHALLAALGSVSIVDGWWIVALPQNPTTQTIACTTHRTLR